MLVIYNILFFFSFSLLLQYGLRFINSCGACLYITNSFDSYPRPSSQEHLSISTIPFEYLFDTLAMFVLVLSFVLLLLTFSSPSIALRAVPSGHCAAVCGDVTTTKGTDIVCVDQDYGNTPKGLAFEACISCQMNSTAVDTTTGETDLQWMLCKSHPMISTQSPRSHILKLRYA